MAMFVTSVLRTKHRVQPVGEFCLSLPASRTYRALQMIGRQTRLGTNVALLADRPWLQPHQQSSTAPDKRALSTGVFDSRHKRVSTARVWIRITDARH